MNVPRKHGARDADDHFPTPEPLARRIVERLAELGCAPKLILEPSASREGEKKYLTADGREFASPFSAAAHDQWPDAEICEVIFPHTTLEMVYGAAGPDDKFDLVLGNPPYALAEGHCRMILNRLLAPDGVLAFLFPASFHCGSDRATDLFEAYRLVGLAPINPRPSFTPDGKTGSTDYDLFVWPHPEIERDADDYGRLLKAIVWDRPPRAKKERKPRVLRAMHCAGCVGEGFELTEKRSTCDKCGKVDMPLWRAPKGGKSEVVAVSVALELGVGPTPEAIVTDVAELSAEERDRAANLEFQFVVSGPPQSRSDPVFEDLKLIGLLCGVCEKPQRASPGGAVCVNGHGGAEGYDPLAKSGFKLAFPKVLPLEEKLELPPIPEFVIPEGHVGLTCDYCCKQVARPVVDGVVTMPPGWFTRSVMGTSLTDASKVVPYQVACSEKCFSRSKEI